MNWKVLNVICNMNRVVQALIIVVSFISVSLEAQYDINIDIANYENDTLIIGYYYGDKQLVHDTLYSEKQGQFKLQGEDTLTSGLYMILTLPDKEYVQFNVNDTEKNFDISYDLNNKGIVNFKGSRDNEIFQNYMQMLGDLRPKAEQLRDTIASLKEANKSFAAFEKELDDLDQKVMSTQKDIIENHPTTISSLILKSSEEIEVPEFKDAEDQQLARFRYYKKHYFDNVDLANPSTLNIGVLPNKVTNYLEKLTSNHPDSLSKSLDFLLTEMEPAESTFRFYLSTFLSNYGNSKVIGYDAIYVHLVDNYYSKGKAPWVNEENLTKIIDNANKIRPTLIGKIGSDLTVYKEDGKTPVTLSEIEYEYLVLLFWAPDCGHCTKMMPDFVAFNNHWKDTGVKLFAICTKHQDKTQNCWDKLEDKNMLGFINAADQYHRSRFKLKYNVVTTPKVFVLNKEREILMKNIGADQLDAVMRDIFKRNNQEDLLPAEMEKKEDDEPKKHISKDVKKAK